MMTEPIDPKNLSLAERLDQVPMDQKEKLEQSWKVVESDIVSKEKYPEGVTISKVECKDSEEAQKTSEELYEFLSKVFKDPEVADPMQIQIGMENGFIDNFVARDEKGKIVSYMQSQTIETQSASGTPELSMVVWYLQTDNKSKVANPMVTKSVASECFANLLKKSQEELKPIKAMFTEAEPEVERIFNLYPGMKRVYGTTADGKLMEAPYLCPPEDESTEGVPAHFMIKMLNGESSISKDDYMALAKSIHDQYTREQYFTPEAFAYAEELDPKDVDPDAVKAYWENYKGITKNIQTQMESALESVEGDLTFLSAKERKNIEKK